MTYLWFNSFVFVMAAVVVVLSDVDDATVVDVVDEIFDFNRGEVVVSGGKVGKITSGSSGIQS